MKSIRQHLLGSLTLWLAVVWLLAGTALYLTVRHNLRSRFDAELDALASEVRQLLPGAVTEDAATVPLRMLDLFVIDSGYYFQIWDDSGIFSDRSPSLGDVDLTYPASFGDSSEYQDATLSTGEKVRTRAWRVQLPFDASTDGGEALSVGLMVARNRDALDHVLSLVIAGTVVVGFLVLAVCAAVIAVAVHSGLAPLSRLGEQAASITPSSLTTRFQCSGLPAELYPITERLNDLLARMDAGFERERRFTSDVAHELRTPVAELKTMAECALRWPDRATPDTMQEVLDVADQLQGLLESLLALTRLEQRADLSFHEDVDLAKTVAACWAFESARADGKKLQVTMDVPADLTLCTDGASLRIILGNLLSNAVAYTPEGGTVVIEGRDYPGKGIGLRITNSPAAISGEDVDHLFDRFWRKDASRSDASHHGLGLSIARSAAEMMGYQLAAELDDRCEALSFVLNCGSA